MHPRGQIGCGRGVVVALAIAVLWACGSFDVPAATAATVATGPVALAWPAEHWLTRDAREAGLSPEKLAQLAAHVGGRGCVVRDGYMIFTWGDAARSSDTASAFKPVLSTLML